MKKLILLTCAAAAVALVACSKTEPAGSENADNGSPRFKISVNIPTKNVNAYTETTADNLNHLIVYGGLKQNGQVFNKSILWDNDKPKFAHLSNKETSYYFLTNSKNGELNDQVPLPLGTTLDAIFLGGDAYSGFDEFEETSYDRSTDRTEFNDYTTYGNSLGWKKPVVFDKDNTVADYLAFKYVNTDEQQFDVVYGVKNDIKSSETTVITLKHAQALINLNVRVTNPAAAYGRVKDFYILFIDGNAVASHGTLKDFLLGQQSGASSLPSDYYTIMGNFHNDMSSPSYDAYMPLKKVGDFVIDNTMNTPVAEWHLYQWNAVSNAVGTDYHNVRLLNDADINSAINTYTTEKMDTDFYSDANYRQAGSQLIPEQPTVNPWLYYKIDGTPHLTEVNIPRGIWERGHVYTYNLSLTFGDMRFTIGVEPYDDPIDVIQKDLK